MKNYNCEITKHGNQVATAQFKAQSIKSARTFANSWKRREGYQGVTSVRLDR